MVENKVIHGYKGFDKDMKCRDFQFEENGVYHVEKAKACEEGFHFCENPIDIFQYYSPADSIFRKVEGSGKTDKHDEDSKIACTDIKIGLSLSLHDFIREGIKFFFEKRSYLKKTSKHSTGYRSASSATGDRSASSATGGRSASSATGDRSASSATGYSSASSATGGSSASSATGYRSASSATGYRSASSATGDRSASSATGYSSTSSATGYSSTSSATGDSSASSATGYSSTSVCTGLYSKAMAGKYGCIALAWYNEKEDRSEMKCAETGCGDGSDGKLKADVWYSISDDGQFVEVN